MRKKKVINYYPFTAIGGFFEEDYIEEFIEVVGNPTCLNIIPYLERFFKNFDYSKHPEYLKGLICIHNVNMNFNEGESYEGEGFYIGVPVLLIPEHISMKRANIDVRELMIDMKLINKNAHPDSIVLFSKVIKDDL